MGLSLYVLLNNLLYMYLDDRDFLLVGKRDWIVQQEDSIILIMELKPLIGILQLLYYNTRLSYKDKKQHHLLVSSNQCHINYLLSLLHPNLNQLINHTHKLLHLLFQDLTNHHPFHLLIAVVSLNYLSKLN